MTTEEGKLWAREYLRLSKLEANKELAAENARLKTQLAAKNQVKTYAQNNDGVGQLVNDLMEGTPRQFRDAIRAVRRAGKLNDLTVALGLKTRGKSLTRRIGDIARKLYGEHGNKYLAACLEPEK